MNTSQQPNLQESSFLSEVVRASGEKISACFQCQKCSAGCPVAYTMDILPNQVLRHIQYDHRDRVLSSKTIWICASCYACSVRCPNNIDIAKIMDTLRAMAIRSGSNPGEKEIPLFHSLFLNTIRVTGRMYELGLILQLKLKTRNFFKDAGLGLKMYRRGKIKLFPPKFRGSRMKEIFDASEQGDKR